MNEITPIAQDQYKVEAEQKKELKHLGSQLAIPGHILWEFNEAEFTLVRADFKVSANLSKGVQKKVVVKENCYYFQALNFANALKKLEKAGLIKFTQ